jgi:iron-sulfur cluster repair protein YtfE (RIC family)
MLLKIGQRSDHGFDQPLGLLSDCHRRIEQFLHVLITLAQQAAGSPLTDPQRAQLDAALTYFSTAAPRHTADEEESLFPRLKQSSDPAAAHALELLSRLEHDHADADRHHQAVAAIGRRWLQQGALQSGEITELRRHLAAVQAIYETHIAIEDRELFPAAARLLSRDEIHDIGSEMAARRRR